MTTRNLVAEELDAELRATETTLDRLEAEANARRSRAELAEIFELNIAKARARRRLTLLPRRSAGDAARIRREIEALLREVEAGIERLCLPRRETTRARQSPGATPEERTAMGQACIAEWQHARH